MSAAKSGSIDDLKAELKRLLVENLNLEDTQPQDIADDANLFGDDGVGLDSLDGVEVVVIMHRNYGLDVKTMQKNRDVFRTINTLAEYVKVHATK